jgi:hypothetical protein
MSAASEVEKARMFIGFAVDRLCLALAEAGRDQAEDFRHRIAQLANQGLELEALQRMVCDPTAELVAMLGAEPGATS